MPCGERGRDTGGWDLDSMQRSGSLRCPLVRTVTVHGSRLSGRIAANHQQSAFQPVMDDRPDERRPE